MLQHFQSKLNSCSVAVITLYNYVYITCCVFIAATGGLESRVCAHRCQTSRGIIKTVQWSYRTLFSAVICHFYIRFCIDSKLCPTLLTIQVKYVHLLFLFVLTGMAQPHQTEALTQRTLQHLYQQTERLCAVTTSPKRNNTTRASHTNPLSPYILQ